MGSGQCKREDLVGWRFRIRLHDNLSWKLTHWSY